MKTTYVLFKNLAQFLTLATLTSLIALTSCKKIEEEIQKKADADTQSAEDVLVAVQTLNDVTNITDESGRTGSLKQYKNNEASSFSCATITQDTISPERKIIVDFGNQNCMCVDGRSRRGKIIVKYTGKFLDVNTPKNVTYENYFVNDHQVKGTTTLVFPIDPKSEKPQCKTTSNLEIIKPSNGGTIKWNGTVNRTWEEGAKTLSIYVDDVFHINGDGSGVSSNGTNFSLRTTKPLVRKMSIDCRNHFISGIIELDTQGKPKKTIDFGDGTCDNLATLTVSGVSHKITL